MHVGIVGAGIGGVMAGICLADAGAQVTILEAAPELGEIGAGIQMTPNVSRLLVKYGVDKAIGANLVTCKDGNLLRWDGTQVGKAPFHRVEEALKQPWWVVHRAHLHDGLVQVAKQRGVNIVIDSRVDKLEYEDTPQDRVKVLTEKGDQYTFDLLIGADGVQSIVRRTLFPGVKPLPPSGNAAYRAIVPMEQVLKHPELKEMFEDLTMHVWMGPKAYIISYPITGGKDFNMVLSHFVDPPCSATQSVEMEEVKREYADWDPRIRKIIDMVPSVQRWPLLVTGPLKSWSSPQKNVVLMGDAAHSMQNHMAQGAATSMEDGAFLATCVRDIMAGSLTRKDAIEIYEKGRMPRAHAKQQVSYMNGYIWMLDDGPAQEARDAALAPELRGEQPLRSPNCFSDPGIVLDLYGYDAEVHAEEEIAKFQNHGDSPRDKRTGLTSDRAEAYVNWFLPESRKFQIKSHL